MPTLICSHLETIVARIFERSEAPSSHAERVANHLVESNILGHDSHGVLRVPQYCLAIENGELVPDARPKIERESESGAVLDGCLGFGQVAAAEAMSLALEKARRSGIAAITLRNCYHSGRLGAYSQMAAEAGFIGIVMVNAGGGGQSVTPFGGTARRLATNPFSIAAPSGGKFPIVLDIATSMAPEGKVRDYALRGARLPEGWIIDSKGRPSCDPQDFYGPPVGSLLPLGGPAGHKGFGIALMIDILAGALSGAGCCRDADLPARDGLLLIALDIEQFTDRAVFHQHVSELVAHVKSCPVAPGFGGVYVPGELEYREAQQRRQSGITLEGKIWEELQAIGARLGIAVSADHGTDGRLPRIHAAPSARRSDMAAR